MRFIDFSFLLIISYVFAADEEKKDDEKVVVLTDSTFDDFLKDNPLTLVEFYAPWCHHCQQLAPEYEAAAVALADKDSKVKLAKVDATTETEISQRFEIGGYPTLKFFRNGEAEEFDGGRTTDAILQYIDKQIRPPVTYINNKNSISDYLNNDSILFIYSGHNNTDLYKMFSEIANKNRDAGHFINYESDKDEISVERREEGTTILKEMTKEGIQEFVDLEKFFLFGAITGDTYMQYAQRELPIVWACMNEEASKKYRKVFEDVGREFRSELSVVWLNTDEFGSHAEGSLGVTDYPALAVTLETGRYIYDEKKFSEESNTEKFTSKSVIEFLKAAKDGKLEKSLKSEAVPEKNDEPVKVVVGKNFEEVVFGGKDVLLEVYAPWCGHCKKLEPIYLEFAESVAGNDHLIIAKMDGTANESPVENFDWDGFPALFFIKAGSKPGDAPLMYEGDRTKEALLTYVQENSTKPDFVPKARDEL
eukprot:GHVL01020155.1.p1 GENE.GHVL01020155.1~~GHVL01020155.1.p1  ORF type:complete len:478 (+),score=104.90 GHVL01020155.1:63-1496(+)